MYPSLHAGERPSQRCGGSFQIVLDTLPSSESSSLLVQDHTQKGVVDANLAVVLDETQFSELVHEKIDPRACRADHLCQHLLRYFGKYLLRLVRRAITR